MKVSKRIEAVVTNTYVSGWNDEIEVLCGDDKIVLAMDESQQRKLMQNLQKRITEHDEERAKELENAETATADD